MGEDILISIVCAMALVVGLTGTLLPFLPGVAFMWVSALLYGFVVGYTTIGVVAMIALTALTVASIVAGVIVPRKAAQESGASTRSQIVGVIGAVVGFFVIPIVGAIVGALAGVLLSEYLARGSFEPAWAATVGTAKGFGLGALIQFGFGFGVLIVWTAWATTVIF